MPTADLHLEHMCASNRYNLLRRASYRMRMRRVIFRRALGTQWVRLCLPDDLEVYLTILLLLARLEMPLEMPARIRRLDVLTRLPASTGRFNCIRINKDIPNSEALTADEQTAVRPKDPNDGRTFKGCTLRYIYCSFKLVKCFQICSKNSLVYLVLNRCAHHVLLTEESSELPQCQRNA